MTISGSELDAIAEQLVAAEYDAPSTVSVDAKEHAVVPEESVRELIASCRQSISFAWSDPERAVQLDRVGYVRRVLWTVPAELDRVLALLSTLPFAIAVGGAHYTMWGLRRSPLRYNAPRLSPHD